MMGDQPLWANLAAFTASAAAIWWAGTRLERYAAAISIRTDLGQAFAGMLLLAIATSLPEVATTVTAAGLLGNPTLAVHNLLGGVAAQTVILVVADFTTRRKRPLTSTPEFALLMQGVSLLVLLNLVIAGIAAGGGHWRRST